MKYRFITGSNAFFTKFDDFKSKDIDVLIIDDKPTEYKDYRQIHLTKGKCVFEWRNMSSDEFINFALEHQNPPMQMIKFLTPDFIKHINLTIDQLKKLQPLVDNLDEKHSYAKIIYDAYISNNSFTLTDDQLKEAYEEYKLKRK